MTDETQTTEASQTATPTPVDPASTPPAPEPAIAKHPFETIDEVVRTKGLGDKDVPGSGVAALLRHVAAQLGIHASDFTAAEQAAKPKA